jgi:predicted Rossmann-fold nucleotide-binding protein
MQNYLLSNHYDLITPDGFIESIEIKNPQLAYANVTIKNISKKFVGFEIEKQRIFFNLKSTLAQLSLEAIGEEYEFDKKNNRAHIKVKILAFSKLGQELLKLLSVNDYIGKLFAQDERRVVKDPNYLLRMFGRCDYMGNPLLSIGNPQDINELILEKIDGQAIAFLQLKHGIIEYDKSINTFLPSLTKILKNKKIDSRALLSVQQKWIEGAKKGLKKDDLLLVRTLPLHIRTVFAKVKKSLLPRGYNHTTACVLEPNTEESGDIYEFYGSSDVEIKEIPLEFYSLEPFREYVFFEDRDQLQASLEDDKTLFDVFEKVKIPKDKLIATFIEKGTTLENLKDDDWIVTDGKKHEFPYYNHHARQSLLVKKYVEEMPQYPILKAIEDGTITSQGVLISRYFPTPLLKAMLLSSRISHIIKRIYFQYPSRSNDFFFSHEDRAFLQDLAKFAIPIFWVDPISKKVLEYCIKPSKETGLFVPPSLANVFRKATFFGVYGSNLLEKTFESELTKLLKMIKDTRFDFDHPLLNKNTPIALLTGGGPGAMEVGNRAAKKVDILSCANIIDFRQKKRIINEQKQNTFIDAKMTYRLDRLVERQAEFHLDFPIFLKGGIGTDFEYCLEEVKRKVGATKPKPILLFGDVKYWREKITSRFKCNLNAGTIKGSEWVSNCFYCVQSAEEGYLVYKDFFANKLKIGMDGPIYKDGFCTEYNT